MSLSLTKEAIAGRFELASRLSELRVGSRFDTKVDLSPAGIERRLREASDLLDVCRALLRRAP